MMGVMQTVQWLAGEAEVLAEHLHQCRFDHYKYHMSLPRVEPGPPQWEASDWPPELWTTSNWYLHTSAASVSVKKPAVTFQLRDTFVPFFFWGLLNDSLGNADHISFSNGTTVKIELERLWIGRGIFQGTTPALSWRDWGKPRTTPVKTIYVPAEIRTGHRVFRLGVSWFSSVPGKYLN
jgi:hypothetical protein